MTQATILQPRKNIYQNPLLKKKKAISESVINKQIQTFKSTSVVDTDLQINDNRESGTNQKIIIDPTSDVAYSKDIATVIQQYGELPPKTSILGICNDNLPILFDLTDARTGPLIVFGDDRLSANHLLQWITQSAITLNRSDQFKFLIISSKPGDWKTIISEGKQSGHWLELADMDQDSIEAGSIIIKMAELAENRINENKADFPIFLVIDDLQLITREDPDVRLNFEWLCINGAQVHIWVISSLLTAQALSLGRWVRYFKTRVLGHMPDDTAIRLGLHNHIETSTFNPGIEFAVWINNDWMRFHLPGE